MFFPVHTLTRNELEQAWTTWNKLEPLERAGTKQNELERDAASKD